jgi:threonine/homoserine/homoserine lactone efflux protein
VIPLESLVTFTIASIILGIAPGPDNIFVLTQSALYGRKAGIFVTIGLCTGLIFHTTIVTIGVATLFQTSYITFTIIKIIGALYLLYLSWQLFKTTSTNLENPKVKELSIIQLYRRGIIMNVTNPKVTIFFLAFLPQFALPINGSIAQQIFILGIVFILVTLIVFGSIAFLAGSFGSWLNKSNRTQILMNRAVGIIFAGLAIKLATTTMNI